MVSMIHFIHGFTHLRDIHKYYEMSILSVHCSSIRLGYDALTKLFDALGRNLNTCKTAVHSLEVQDRFIYQKDKKASVVEYKDEIIDVYCVLTYRDLNESAAEQENYLRHMECGDKAYTKESFEKANYYLGVMVLQTSLEDKSPKKSMNFMKNAGVWNLL